MTTSGVSSDGLEATLPACLFENSLRLVSLWQMLLRIEPGHFSFACNIFGQACMDIRHGNKPTAQTLGVIKAELERVVESCSKAQLRISLAQGKRAQTRL